MPMMEPDGQDNQRTFWIPVHKLFDGKECIAGLDLALNCSAKFFNMKLSRVMKSLNGNKPPPSGFPFVIEDGLAELKEHSEFGRIAVAPVVQDALVQQAIVDGKPLTYRVPKNPRTDGFATYATKIPRREDLAAEIHPFPAYVHARTMVKDGILINLNNEEDGVDVEAAVKKGNYDALLHFDLTGEGWVDVQVPAVAGKSGVQAGSRAAYILLSAPDFFPSCGQRELGRWARSPAVPAKFRGQVWATPPNPLSDTRWPANLQLPNNPFDENEDTITAVTGMGPRTGTPSTEQQRDAMRASTLPDDGAGVFAPGWDVAVDIKGPLKTGTPHLAAYGLGSPFPEDVKLCAALSTFWPAVAPDVYRTMSMHGGGDRGTVAPLTDEEIGQIGTLPWDGVPGPRLVHDGEATFVEMARFLNVDYVVNAIENQFSNRLTARISAEEYERRVLAAARVHWVLSGGTNVDRTRARWLMISFRSMSLGDPELIAAQNQAGHILEGPVYRVEACFVGNEDPSIKSPKGPRFRRVPLRQHTSFFVSAEDPMALRRRDINPQWGRVKAE